MSTTSIIQRGPRTALNPPFFENSGCSNWSRISMSISSRMMFIPAVARSLFRWISICREVGAWSSSTDPSSSSSSLSISDCAATAFFPRYFDSATASLVFFACCTVVVGGAGRFRVLVVEGAGVFLTQEEVGEAVVVEIGLGIGAGGGLIVFFDRLGAVY